VVARYFFASTLTLEEQVERESVLDRLAANLRKHLNTLYPRLSPWATLTSMRTSDASFVEVHAKLSASWTPVRVDLDLAPADWRKGLFYDRAGRRYRLKDLKAYVADAVARQLDEPPRVAPSRSEINSPAPSKILSPSKSAPSTSEVSDVDLKRAFEKVIDRLGRGSTDPVEVTEDEMFGAYRSDLPKEGASTWEDAHSYREEGTSPEADAWYDRLVQEEIHRARTELDRALKPYRARYTKYTLRPQEKGWIDVRLILAQ
jgi:hypothetical protein